MPNAIQRFVGILGAVITAPLVVALALAIRIDSRGPAIYAARRVGRHGRVFKCLKLRTMTWSPASPGDAITVGDDSRVTRVGGWLRRHRLDELPQLWNVARGDMALVGPRPEDPRFVDVDDDLHREVFSALPGITGLTQLAFADEAAQIDPRDAERHYRETILPLKLALDRDYLRRRSLSLDLWILGQTVTTAVGRRTSLASIEAHR
jgi:lipopolysaccharide/colanic/teichoic acid biosynthesis glycosyltransferase